MLNHPCARSQPILSWLRVPHAAAIGKALPRACQQCYVLCCSSVSHTSNATACRCWLWLGSSARSLFCYQHIQQMATKQRQAQSVSLQHPLSARLCQCTKWSSMVPLDIAALHICVGNCCRYYIIKCTIAGNMQPSQSQRSLMAPRELSATLHTAHQLTHPHFAAHDPTPSTTTAHCPQIH